jgi:hypothetical protein
MSIRLHNEMDAIEGHAHYRCDIYNEISHNRKTCLNRQSMYDKTIVCKIYIIFLSCYGVLFFYAF